MMNSPGITLPKSGKLILGCILLFVASSCASTKPPTDKLTRTQVAINQAEQVGARDYAPLEIREAKKKLEKAQELIEQKKYEQAARLSDEAEVDAQLAEAKTVSGKAQKAVRELRESIKALKQEIERNQQDQ